jgi:hypothetical protein
VAAVESNLRSLQSLSQCIQAVDVKKDLAYFTQGTTDFWTIREETGAARQRTRVPLSPPTRLRRTEPSPDAATPPPTEVKIEVTPDVGDVEGRGRSSAAVRSGSSGPISPAGAEVTLPDIVVPAPIITRPRLSTSALERPDPCDSPRLPARGPARD